MSNGSGLFAHKAPVHPHLVQAAGGFSKEISDLRADVAAELLPLLALTVDEYINPVGLSASAADAILAATATVASVVTLHDSDLVTAGLLQLAQWPRQLVFTTAGTTPSDAPATAAITGADEYGNAQTETVTLAQTATTATSTKYWSVIESIVFPAADGTGATIAIGFTAAVVKKATATVASPVTLGPTDIIQTDLANNPRALVFTTAGSTASDAPATATVKGKDAKGKSITEVVTLAQTATTATSKNFFAEIESIAYPAADGTGATIAITPSAAFGTRQMVKARAGAANLVREVAAGSLVTTGTLAAPSTTDLPYGSYTPSSAADGANDYAIYYEYVPSTAP